MKILVFPEERGVNPYQDNLYNGLKKFNNEISIKYFSTSFFNKYILGIFNIPIFPKLIWYKINKKFQIIHIHWTFPLRFPFEHKIFKFIDYYYQLTFLKLIKLLRYKIVWTVHEILPHDVETSDDLSLRKYLSEISDAKIVHSHSTIIEMNKMGLSTENTIVIPHGNYISNYENVVNKSEARRKLGIDKSDFVFLHFGVIEERKGINTLLETFSKIIKKDVKLLLVGKIPDSPDKSMNKLLGEMKRQLGNNFILIDKFIRPNDAQYYFSASDIVVLPFKKIGTSGTVILSLSFGKPIICPKIGNIIDLPSDIGIFYDSFDKNGLYKSMKEAIKLKKSLDIMGNYAFEYAENILSWSKISQDTYDVYKDIMTR